MIELTIPYPPTVNNYKMVGRTITTKSGKFYQKRVNTSETKLFYYEVWMAIHNLKIIKQISSPIGGTISLSVSLYPPDKRKRDIDNVAKPLIDSLVKGGLIVDDVQISRLFIERCETIEKGKVIIKIEMIDEKG